MNNNNIEEKKEDSDEEYQIIKEDYHSSPKCGIKSQFSKKSTKNIIFSPIEISTKPYLKYCVIPIKEEQKNDISQDETTQTKINEDKSKNSNMINHLKNINNKNDELKLSNNHINKEKEENTKNIQEEQENVDDKESEETNYIHIIEKKSSELTLSDDGKYNEEKEYDHLNLKSRQQHQKRKGYHNSLRIKDNRNIKMKLNLNNEEERDKLAQKNLINFFNNNILPKNIFSTKINGNKLLQSEGSRDLFKTKSTLKEKNGEKKYSPKNINIKKNKSEPIKIASAFTTNNIKRIKKTKKAQDNNEIKKVKTNVTRQHSFIPLRKDKKIKIHNEDKDKDIKDLKSKRRHSQIHKTDNKNDNNIFINILNNNENKKIKKNKSRHQKMKSLMEKNNEILKLDKETKKNEHENCGTPKKRVNYTYKLKIEESLKDGDNNRIHEFQKTTKARKRVSIFDHNNNENRKKKRLHTEDKKEGNLNKKKNTFSSLKEKDKERDRDKDKDKEKNYIKEKEKKIKNKRTKRNRQKEKYDKYKKFKKESSNNNKSIKKPKRKDKSFTIVSQTNKNLISDEELINLNDSQNNNNSFNSSKSNLNNNEKNAKNSPLKPSPTLNNNTPIGNNLSDIRRNSTRELFRDINHKEKITAYTNKQTIKNINEYTRYCLKLIPDIYELGDKMPRCKTKINMNFSKNKKIALFDLDETIVHCIGEINLNNLEFLSRQSDARIKVHLPGGKKEVTIGINIRPYWEEALNKIKNKYHIVAFTASHESYADSVLNYLDPNNKYFEYRLYRCHCVFCVMDSDTKFYIKDLKIMEDNYDLKDIVIIDNSVLSFAYHLDNGIPISPFYDSKKDTELLDIADFLVKYADENDIRDKLKEVYKLNEFLELLKNYTSEEEDDSSDMSAVEEDNMGYTTKNLLNKNRTNINLNQPLLVNDSNKKLIKDDLRKISEKNNNNISQNNSKLKEITKLFIHENNNNNGQEDNKHFTPKLNEQKKIKKYIHPNFEIEKNYIKSRKKETQRFGINFKKEWEQKQRELKNK